ncbi:protein of unknown function [Streptococcus thermophilus]|uniref:Uncharacterized protein n=1 Tax=Streptococcus thermophilus TaxID=1308 RepID=A0A8D6XQ13_STRTR|nr:protein of unknown function [Streptococcus thermophilus]
MRLILLAKKKQALNSIKKETGFKLYEHFISRIKESDSMREKCRRKNLPETKSVCSQGNPG